MITQVDLKHLSTTKLVELKHMVEKELKFRDDVGKEIESIKRTKILARSMDERHTYYTEEDLRELRGGM